VQSFPSRRDAAIAKGVAMPIRLARPGLLGALLAALLLRMLVPAGFMVERGALVPCDGVAAAAAPAVHHHGGHSQRQEPAGHRQAPCPYAALAAPVLPPLPPVVVAAFIVPAVAAPIPALGALLAPGAAAPLPPATGPPHRA